MRKTWWVFLWSSMWWIAYTSLLERRSYPSRGQAPEIYATRLKRWAQPGVINTDKNPSYTKAIAELKEEGKCSAELKHRQVKYLNNIIESDHGKLKRLIKPTLGFKSMRTAYATIKGFEVMRMFKKGRFEFGGVFIKLCQIEKLG